MEQTNSSRHYGHSPGHADIPATRETRAQSSVHQLPSRSSDLTLSSLEHNDHGHGKAVLVDSKVCQIEIAPQLSVNTKANCQKSDVVRPAIVTSPPEAKFHLFQKLPFDLKFMIWKAAVKNITEHIITLEEYEKFFENYAYVPQDLRKFTCEDCHFTTPNEVLNSKWSLVLISLVSLN